MQLVQKFSWVNNETLTRLKVDGNVLDPRLLTDENFKVTDSQTPLHGHMLNADISLLSKDSLLSCPWGKKSLTFSLNSTRLIWTPHYYKQFALSLGKESPYIFSKVNPLNMDTPVIQTLSMAPLSVHFNGLDCASQCTGPERIATGLEILPQT